MRMASAARPLSIGFGIASLVPVAYYFYQSWLFSQWAQAQARQGGFVCGTGMAALVMVCAIAAGACSAVAAVFGLVGYIGLPKPRPRKRLLEVMLAGSVVIIMLIATAIAIAVFSL